MFARFVHRSQPSVRGRARGAFFVAGVPAIQVRPAICLCMCLCIFLPLCGCVGDAKRQQEQPVSETRLLLDTVCTITIFDNGADPSLPADALDLCYEYETLLSRTLEGSDVWRINHAGGEPVRVDTRCADVIQAGLHYGDISGGMFDVTVGRLCALWGFGGNPKLPAAPDLDQARATADYRQVSVAGDTVQLANPEAWLDLGGISKGYIADQVASFLIGRGVKAAVIDLGGDIVTVGCKPDGKPWRVGVKRPSKEDAGDSGLLGVLTTTEASVVTSGIYERQFEENGVLYHHILDPRTGYPVESDVVSVTVVSESSMAGDAISTVILLEGSEQAQALLEDVPGLTGVILVLKTGNIIQYGDIDFEEE